MKTAALIGLMLACGAASSARDLVHPEKRSLVICKEPGRYIGWPTIARTAEGGF